jgi:hypothetical protein
VTLSEWNDAIETPFLIDRRNRCRRSCWAHAQGSASADARVPELTPNIRTPFPIPSKSRPAVGS